MSDGMTPAPTGGITDLESWSKVAARRPAPRGHPLRDRPASRPATTQPGDFAIDATGPLKAGADPDRVGPKKAARPPRPSA